GVVNLQFVDTPSPQSRAGEPHHAPVSMGFCSLRALARCVHRPLEAFHASSTDRKVAETWWTPARHWNATKTSNLRWLNIHSNQRLFPVAQSGPPVHITLATLAAAVIVVCATG